MSQILMRGGSNYPEKIGDVVQYMYKDNNRPEREHGVVIGFPYCETMCDVRWSNGRIGHESKYNLRLKEKA